MLNNKFDFCLISSEFGAEFLIRIPPELANDDDGVDDNRDDDGDIHDVGDGDNGDEYDDDSK